ncbi:hypothetical protein SODG_001283 [Sodalis praecaptivus]
MPRAEPVSLSHASGTTGIQMFDDVIIGIGVGNVDAFTIQQHFYLIIYLARHCCRGGRYDFLTFFDDPLAIFSHP